MRDKKKNNLPAAAGHLVSLGHLLHVNANHGLTQTLANLSKNLGILEVGNGLDNGLRALLSITRLEDTGADEDAVAAQLHHQRRIGGSSNTASSEVDNGQTAELGSLAEQLVGGLELTGKGAELRLGVSAGGVDSAGAGNLGVDGAHVLNGLDDVAGTGFTLGADHGSTLGDAAQGLAQVAAAADEGNLEGGLGNVVDIVGGGQDFRLVDVVDTNGLENLVAGAMRG